MSLPISARLFVPQPCPSCSALTVDSCLSIQCHGLFPLSACLDVSTQLRERWLSAPLFSRPTSVTRTHEHKEAGLDPISAFERSTHKTQAKVSKRQCVAARGTTTTQGDATALQRQEWQQKCSQNNITSCKKIYKSFCFNLSVTYQPLSVILATSTIFILLNSLHRKLP